MNQAWFEDMMCQTYNEDICFNPSKLFLLQFITENGTLKDRYKIYDFQMYLYRIYSDNPEVAEKHPSYLIRKIKSYGVKDLEVIARDTLDSWVRDAKNNILRVGEKYFVIQLDFSDAEDIVKNTTRLCGMMYKKIFGGIIPQIHDIEDEEILRDDKNVDVFGRSLYMSRVLEDMQYCPICEEIDSKKLICTHICGAEILDEIEILKDKDNGLIFCREHGEKYINNQFYFDEFGFAHDIDSGDIEPGMHLSFAIKSAGRKQYLKLKKEWLANNGYIG